MQEPPPKKVTGWGELFKGANQRAAKQEEQKATIKPAPPSSISSHTSDSSATKKSDALNQEQSSSPAETEKDTVPIASSDLIDEAVSDVHAQPSAIDNNSKDTAQQPPQPPKPAWKKPAVESLVPVAVDWPTLDDAKQPGKSPVTSTGTIPSFNSKVSSYLISLIVKWLICSSSTTAATHRMTLSPLLMLISHQGLRSLPPPPPPHHQGQRKEHAMEPPLLPGQPQQPRLSQAPPPPPETTLLLHEGGGLTAKGSGSQGQTSLLLTGT